MQSVVQNLCVACTLQGAHRHTHTHTHQAVTLARSRSIAFMRLPWKYLTLVCCLFSKPSNSKSGSALEQKANFASLKKHNEWISLISKLYIKQKTKIIFSNILRPRTYKINCNIWVNENYAMVQLFHKGTNICFIKM